ncbi:hypothetical protein NDU88_002874 [Pleurodeles waltl]|uniref:Uncharacterized protein n=1 Tax=Pleurodeles waltl TaxID=8319 RepID=A0AAV7MU15_PLEWA|nr:hypothetical protein NDU88_002874 [Pleurodeles waltl]
MVAVLSAAWRGGLRILPAKTAAPGAGLALNPQTTRCVGAHITARRSGAQPLEVGHTVGTRKEWRTPGTPCTRVHWRGAQSGPDPAALLDTCFPPGRREVRRGSKAKAGDSSDREEEESVPV